ncbi:hypothetical protein KTE62_29850 [Burkholderia multivorans]|uniref:hypothetical protein n=1 Tax=Burkholderia multivorans TaxID=87883 RepID=UPI001C218A71|nr:hypothetical protein [Burkholderia multivorans]MBU9445901.1 hypothetical protein [Burkholderia multivorans]
MANAHSIPVLTHEAFARAPVANSRRHGRLPKSVVRLADARRSRSGDEASLRAWAREHANAYWTLDQVREEKQRCEATELLERSGDKVWQEIARLLDNATALKLEILQLRELLVELQLNNLPRD